MRRFPVVVPGLYLALVSLLLVAITPGCGSGGGGGGAAARVPARVVLSPASLSLGHGLIGDTLVSVLAADDLPVFGFAVTYQSSNPAVVTVAPDGAVCGGVWNEAHTICAPGPVGTATVTATSGGVTSAAINVWVHKRIDRITVAPESAPCQSQGESVQYTATVFSGAEDITATVGPVDWALTHGAVGAFDTEGLARHEVRIVAEKPGRTSVFGRLGNVNSLPATFHTCSPASIAISGQDSPETSFELAVNGTQALAVEVLDTNGNPMTDLGIGWRSVNPTVAAVTGAGVVTGVGPGTTLVVAFCGVPNCMQGLNESHYSNPVTVMVPGTTDTTVYAAGTGSTSLVPIPTGTHTPGTPITLPHLPNSFLFLPNGVRAYLGSDEALMSLEPAGGTIVPRTLLKGKVLAVSNERVIVSDIAEGAVYIFSDSDQDITVTLTLPGVTAAAVSLDDAKVFLLSGTTLYVWSPAAPMLRTLALPAAAHAVAFMANSSLAYLSGGDPQNIMVRSGCDSEFIHGLNSPAPPALIGAIPDNSGMLAVTSPAIQHIDVHVGGTTCAPVVVDSITSRDFGIGGFQARHLIVTSDAKHAFVAADQDRVLAYDIEAGTVSTIPLSGGATEAFSGGATLDSQTVYVGATGTGNAVHRIDVASGLDVQRIEVQFVPDLVRVRPR